MGVMKYNEVREECCSSGDTSISPHHRDGYRGTDTFPTQNRECLPCAQPVPCTQPLQPCSTSMASMSQGHWMRKPRSEYDYMQWGAEAHMYIIVVCALPIQ